MSEAHETHVSLGHGCGAILIEGDEDTPPQFTPEAKKAPAKRWAKNGHLWETCTAGVGKKPCLDCLSRQNGLVGEKD